MLHERDQLSAPDPIPGCTDPDPTLKPAAFPRRAARPAPLVPDLSTAAGLEACRADDLHVPALRIKQSRGEGGAAVRPGEWFVDGAPELVIRELSLVVLEVHRERALLLSEDDPYLETLVRDAVGWVDLPAGQRWPVCRSRDLLRPERAAGLLPLAKECAGCPFTPRGCDEGYRLLVVEPQEGGFIAHYHALGAARRPVRELLTELQLACRRDRAPACGYRVAVGTREVEGPDGPVWIPHFEQPERLQDPAQVCAHAELRRVFSTEEAA